MADPELPEQAAIVRLVDPDMSHALSQWVILNVLDHLRDGRFYRENARHKKFESVISAKPKICRLPYMGAIGLVIAQRLADLGFDVSGWSRSPREFPAPITATHGKDGFASLLSTCEIHVCILPLTAETTNLFDASAFAQNETGGLFYKWRARQAGCRARFAGLYSFWPSGRGVPGCICRRALAAATSLLGRASDYYLAACRGAN